MQLLTTTVRPDFDLVLMGDDHEGSRLKAQSKVETVLDFILAEKHRYFIHMGDAVEAITVDDSRSYLPGTDNPIPIEQAKNVVKQYRRAADRCLLWLLGNHELKLWKFGNLTKDIICEDLNVFYGTYSCNITFDDKYGKMFKGHFRHGLGSNLISNAKDEEQRLANMKATLKMRLKRKFGDTILMAAGCTHKLLVVPPVKTLYMTDDGHELKKHYLEEEQTSNYINPDLRWYVNTGTFRKAIGLGFVDYAELKGYDPLPIGYAIVEVRDRKVVNVREVNL